MLALPLLVYMPMILYALICALLIIVPAGNHYSRSLLYVMLLGTFLVIIYNLSGE